MRTKPILLLLTGLAAVAFDSCQHDVVSDPTDAQLLELAKNNSGSTWFEESDALLPKSGGSGHSEPLLRTRFNPLASTMLDTNGRVLPGAVFPNGSVIVKELWDNAASLSLYAVLYKKPDHPYADEAGWVWGYVRPDGSVKESARKKGSSCRGCHGGGGSIDFSLMNTSFP